MYNFVYSFLEKWFFLISRFLIARIQVESLIKKKKKKKKRIENRSKDIRVSFDLQSPHGKNRTLLKDESLKQANDPYLSLY